MTTMTTTTTAATAPQATRGRKRFSTPALLFGSIISGLGIAGIVATINSVGWDAGLAVGMILGGTTTVVGLLYRYRVTTSSPGVPLAVGGSSVESPAEATPASPDER